MEMSKLSKFTVSVEMQISSSRSYADLEYAARHQDFKSLKSAPPKTLKAHYMFVTYILASVRI